MQETCPARSFGPRAYGPSHGDEHRRFGQFPSQRTQLLVVSSLTLTCWLTDCRIQTVRGPSGDEPIYCCPFNRMSFLTDSTPLTLRATSTALLMSARELTKPLNCTTPLKVSTLISADFSEGSPKTAAFTLVVMTVSSRYSPVPSCLGVEAHPRREISRTATAEGSEPIE